jgi:hypothetical protein
VEKNAIFYNVIWDVLIHGDINGNNRRNQLLYYYFGFWRELIERAQLEGDYVAKAQGFSCHHTLNGYEKTIQCQMLLNE